MTLGKNLYFASDFHLGAPNAAASIEREKKIVRWLSEIADDAKAIYLVGDIFDFWFEYKQAIPKGFVRLQGKLAELSDRGIEIHFFTGNHDMWMFDYFPKELGVKMHREPIQFTYSNIKFYIGHGDGLGPGDHGYKFVKKVFASKICQWLFARLHPDFGIAVANFWSRRSRKVTGDSDENFLGEDQEWLAIYAKEILQKEHFDYFIFGHRHLHIEIQLNETSKYINLGEWIKHYTYLVFDVEKGSCEMKIFSD
jgi:UDP-2,3-diacylglucosamine hydrolase